MSTLQPRVSDRERYLNALRQLWDRSAYDRGFISNPFAGDDFAALGLRRTREVLSRLGNPQNSLRILHVAGSKGKGSTTAFAASILTEAGFRTGRYTSPHLHTFRERFAIDDRLISESGFADIWDRAVFEARMVERAHPDLGPATAFELTTAMAFDYLCAMRCQTAVIEVGLGGTLDSTNVVSPESTIITALDYEHTSVLGSTLGEIASNKAGIIKPGVPVATAVLDQEALGVIAAKAEEQKAPWLLAGRDWRWERNGERFDLHGPWGTFRELKSGLIGDHQIDNASLAVAGLWAMLGENLAEEAVRDGLTKTRWPGRFEVVTRNTQTIVVDGAHTPAAAAALARAFKSNYGEDRAVVILGMLNDKDAKAFVNALREIASRFIAITPQTPRALAAGDLAATIAAEGIPVEIAGSMNEALLMTENALSVITGSLTTVAWAREALGIATADPRFKS